jgi:hypothetical protein
MSLPFYLPSSDSSSKKNDLSAYSSRLAHGKRASKPSPNTPDGKRNSQMVLLESEWPPSDSKPDTDREDAVLSPPDLSKRKSPRKEIIGPTSHNSSTAPPLPPSLLQRSGSVNGADEVALPLSRVSSADSVGRTSSPEEGHPDPSNTDHDRPETLVKAKPGSDSGAVDSTKHRKPKKIKDTLAAPDIQHEWGKLRPIGPFQHYNELIQQLVHCMPHLKNCNRTLAGLRQLV